MNEASKSLYESIGGAPAVEKLIEGMYRRILSDPELAPFFENTSMESLRKMQVAFFSAALDGPMNYSGLELAAAHRGRGIKRHHISRFVDHLLQELKDISVSDHDANAVVARIATYSNEILGESTSDG